MGPAEGRCMMCAKYEQKLMWAAMCLILSTASAASATSIDVTIITSSLMGREGKLVFDYTVNGPPSGQHVEVHDLVTDSVTAGLPETQGGLVEGTVFLPPFTTPGASLAGTAGFAEIGGGSFFNELSLNLRFGSSITFQLHIPEVTSNPGGIPDQFSLFMLNPANEPLFGTSDPTGAESLFVVDILMGVPGGASTAFSPATLTGSSLRIVTPGEPLPPVPEPATIWLTGAGLLLIARKVRAGCGHTVANSLD